MDSSQPPPSIAVGTSLAVTPPTMSPPPGPPPPGPLPSPSLVVAEHPPAAHSAAPVAAAGSPPAVQEVATPAHAGSLASADLSGAGAHVAAAPSVTATASTTCPSADVLPPDPELQVQAWQALQAMGDMFLEGRTFIHREGGALMPVRELVQHIVDTTVVMGFGGTPERVINVTMDFCSRAQFTEQEMQRVHGLLNNCPPRVIQFPMEPDRDTILRHLGVYRGAMEVLRPLLPPHLLGLLLRSAADGDHTVGDLRGIFRALPITLQLAQDMVRDEFVQRTEEAYAQAQVAATQPLEASSSAPSLPPTQSVDSSAEFATAEPPSTPAAPNTPSATTSVLDPAATAPLTPPRSPSPPLVPGNYPVGTNLAWEAMGDYCRHRCPPMPALLPGTKWAATKETTTRCYVVVPKWDTQPPWWNKVSHRRTWTPPADRQAEYAAGDLWSGQYPRRPTLREGLIWDPISSRMEPSNGNIFRVCVAPSPAALGRPRAKSLPRSTSSLPPPCPRNAPRTSDLPASSKSPRPGVPSTPSSIARYLSKALTLAAPQPPYVYTTRVMSTPPLVTPPPAPMARQRSMSSTARPAGESSRGTKSTPTSDTRQHQAGSHPPSKAPMRRDPSRPLSIHLVPPHSPASPHPAPPVRATSPPPPCSVCGCGISLDQLALLRASSVHPTQWMCTACTLKESRDAASLRSHARNPPASAEPPAEFPCASRPAPVSTPRPSKAPRVHKPRSPGPLPSPSQAAPASSETAPASGFSLGQFLDLRDRAITMAQGNVDTITSKRATASQKLADLEARQVQALRSHEPAARRVQTAQAMAGLIAARESELAQVVRLHADACDTLNQLRRQKVGRETGVLAVCDNCCQYIFAAQLPECLPGPRSEALLHCPTCSVNPSLH